MQIDVIEARKQFGKVEALRGVSMCIPAGQKVALVGPNGSGKSTLIRSILGLLRCDGQVRLDGHSPYEHREVLARRLAYVPQVAPALSASVGDLVNLVVRTRGLDKTDVAKSAAEIDLDLEPIRDRPFRQLSGGMKQKALLAMALASRPSLLVMDEPSASLDLRGRMRFLRLLESLPDSTTLILCSHRLDELSSGRGKLARQVFELRDGRVAFDGSAEAYAASIASEFGGAS